MINANEMISFVSHRACITQVTQKMGRTGGRIEKETSVWLSCHLIKVRERATDNNMTNYFMIEWLIRSYHNIIVFGSIFYEIYLDFILFSNGPRFICRFPPIELHDQERAGLSFVDFQIKKRRIKTKKKFFMKIEKRN
jgi:hypothetical protein